MNKAELIEAVAAKTGMTKKDTAATLTGIIEEISAALVKGEKVQLTGFGVFETKQKAARTGKNPRTGETIEIAASNSPAFKAGQKLRDAVNGK